MPDKASKYIFFTVFTKRGHSIFPIWSFGYFALRKGWDIIPSKFRPRSILNLPEHQTSISHIYWSKVLTDQPGSCQFFRKYKIVKNLKRATIKQVIILLSKLLKFSFRKSHYVTFLLKTLNVPCRDISILPLLIIPCIGHWISHFLP